MDFQEGIIMLPVVCTPGTTRENWNVRREVLVELFRQYEFGRRPDLPFQVEGRLVKTAQALEGRAVRELYAVTVTTERGSVELELALVLPAGEEKVPVVMLLSNHDREKQPVTPPDMSLMGRVLAAAPAAWREDTAKIFGELTKDGMPGPHFLDIARDDHQGYWAVEEIIASGRGAAAFYASQAQLDDGTQFPGRLSALFLDPAQERPADGWGTLGVWAFAASCMVDVLEKHRRVDSGRISLGGHSRGGKAALWCAVQDTRIHAVLVNNSGCSGAAISRGKRGEAVASINAFFPHWFCPNYAAFGWKEEEMPFDQHMLVAAVAPRLCCVTSGSEDLWSDPDAEWRGALEGSAAWKLFGYEGLSGECPGPGEVRYESPIAYHKRRGGHDLTAWDWKNFLEFLDRHQG